MVDIRVLLAHFRGQFFEYNAEFGKKGILGQPSMNPLPFTGLMAMNIECPVSNFE